MASDSEDFPVGGTLRSPSAEPAVPYMPQCSTSTDTEHIDNTTTSTSTTSAVLSASAPAVPPQISPFDLESREQSGDTSSAMASRMRGKSNGQSIAPFLSKHLPTIHAPQQIELSYPFPNTKYCYRHSPDTKCKRQPDEPTMEQIQTSLEKLSPMDQQAISQVWATFSAAPAALRILMLQGIVSQCCFPQLSFLSASVRDLIKIDFIAALPPELAYKILCCLDTASLCKAAQVSRTWRMMADDDVVWHRMCEQHIDRKCTKCGWGLPLMEQKRLRQSKRQMELRARGRLARGNLTAISPPPQQPGTPTLDVEQLALDEQAKQQKCVDVNRNGKRSSEDERPDGASKRTKSDMDVIPRFRPWKDVYRDRFMVGINWKHGRYSTKIFKGHTNGVMCLQFNETTLMTGSYDRTIRIWDIETGKELRVLNGHALGVRAIQFDDAKLISGSLDKTMKIWNWHTGECISTLTGHGGGILTLHYESSILVSGSKDHTVRVWNFEDKSTYVLRGHTDWVNCVRLQVESRTVFSASDDFTVRFWDLDSKTCLSVFKGHVGQVQQVLTLPPEFEYEEVSTDDAQSDDGEEIPSIIHRDSYPWPVNTYPPVGYPTGASHSPALSYETNGENDERPLPPRYILTCALDSTIYLWEVSTGRCLKKFFGHLEGIWALAADTLRFVSGGEDRTVKIWDPRTGKCDKTLVGHQGGVTCIGLSETRICTGGDDAEVRMHSFMP